MEQQNNHTFVIMAYKNAPYLETTIQSVLNQKSKSSVCISTSTPNDRIQAIANQYGVPVYINKPGQGIVSDWTFAISCAKTPLVTLADQDDNYLPDFSSKVTRVMSRNPDSIICFTNYSEIGDEGKRRPLNMTMVVKYLLLIPFIIRSVYRSRFFKQLVLRFGDPICSPSVTYNMETIKKHKLFDEAYAVALDWDAWLRLSELQGAFCYIRRSVLDHRIHAGTQTSFGIAGGKRYNEDLKVLKRLWPGWMARFIAWAYSASYHSNH